MMAIGAFILLMQPLTDHVSLSHKMLFVSLLNDCITRLKENNSNGGFIARCPSYRTYEYMNSIRLNEANADADFPLYLLFPSPDSRGRCHFSEAKKGV